MKIRPAEPADAASLVNLVAALGFQGDAQTLEERLRPILRDGAQAVRVAEASRGVVGVVHACVSPLIASGTTLQIVALSVAPGYRGRGVGRRLVEAVVDWSRQRSCSTVRVRCNTRRDEAHEFWRKIGFAETKTQIVFSRAIA